jgi:hypothetical protein
MAAQIRRNFHVVPDDRMRAEIKFSGRGILELNMGTESHSQRLGKIRIGRGLSRVRDHLHGSPEPPDRLPATHHSRKVVNSLVYLLLRHPTKPNQLKRSG